MYYKLYLGAGEGDRATRLEGDLIIKYQNNFNKSINQYHQSISININQPINQSINQSLSIYIDKAIN